MTPIHDVQESAGLPRWMAAALGAGIVLVTIFLACGNFAIDVLQFGCIDGAVLIAWIAAGFGFGQIAFAISAKARITNERETPARDALLQFVSAIALGLGIIGLLTLGLGLMGILSRTSALGLLVVGWSLGGMALRNADPSRVKPWFFQKTSLATPLLALPFAIAFVAASLSPGFLWKPLDPHPYDVLSYHLQIPREWYDVGRIVPLLHNSFSFFPMGMEMHDLLAMHLLGGPYAAMYLCQFMSLAFGALSVLGVIGAVRSFGGSSTIAVISGLAAACVPWTMMLSSVAYVECGVMCYTLLATVWAARAAVAGRGQGEGDRGKEEKKHSVPAVSLLAPAPLPLSPFPTACVFAAFACGMKYTAFAMTAAPVLLLYPLFIWRAHGWRTIRPWLIGCAVCLILVSPWLIRNWVWSGNPVFPLATRIFGSAHFTADQVDRYLQAHAPPLAERPIGVRVRNAWNRVVIDPQFGKIFLPLTVLAIALTWRSIAMRYIAMIVLAATSVWLVATHDMPRFLTPIIPLGFVIVGLAADRNRALRYIGGSLLLVQSIIGLRWTWNTLAPTLDLGRQGIFRLSDLNVIETDEVKAARLSADRVALIGDAQAFFYLMPSEKLLYRGVFDVVVPDGGNAVDAWLGKPVDQLRREGYWVLINTSELNRLSQTYAHIPKPLPPYDVVSPTLIVLPPIRKP